MSAIHSDCRYAIRGDRVTVAGTRYYVTENSTLCLLT